MSRNPIFDGLNFKYRFLISKFTSKFLHTMKEKIIAAIKAKFPAINLSKKRLDAIAAKIEAKVIDDETKIDASLDAFNDFNPIADIAKQDDVIRNYEAKLKGQHEKKEDPEKKDNPEIPDDTPAWAKSLMESNKTLAEKLAAIEGKERHTSIKSAIALKLKDVPANYWEDWQIPEKDEDIEPFIEKVTTKFTAFTKDLTDKGLNVPIPGGGQQKQEKPGEVSAAVKDFVAKAAPKTA